MKIKLLYLILFIFIIFVAYVLAEPPEDPDPPSGPVIEPGTPATTRDSYGHSPTGSDKKTGLEKIENIQSELNVKYKLSSIYENKGKPISVTIQLTSYNDRNRIESISVIEELPPEIEFISADQEANYDNKSRRISWVLSGLYVYKKDLAFNVYSREGGNFQIPTTIKAQMILQDLRTISGYKDVDPISLITYNYGPELIQVHYPNSIIFPFSDRSNMLNIMWI